jgi:hypothetical protein
MAWTGPPGSIVYPDGGGTTGGTVCPAGWEEDFDRSQMSTQVLIARSAPADVPQLYFNLSEFGFVGPPAPGGLVVDPNQEAATAMYISKTDGVGGDATIWVGYLNRHSTVTFNDGGDPDHVDSDGDPDPIPERSRSYELVDDPIEHADYYELPVFWTAGTTHVPAGAVKLTMTIGTEVPQLWLDAYGVAHYGRMTFTRTDLINTDRDLFEKLADRILEVRGSNSVPRLEAVTIDARTGSPLRNMGLMSSAAPEKPSRYRMFLHVDDRIIYDRMCFVTGVRHFIAHNEWTLRVTLDIAEWAAKL